MGSPFAIRGARIVEHGVDAVPTTVIVQDGRIADVATRLEIGGGVQTVEADGAWLSCGFIDLQVNGAYGHDFTSDPNSIAKVARILPRHGVTTFLPTIITGGVEARNSAIGAVRQVDQSSGSARVHGLHFEGPFISEQRAGTHPRALVAPPNADEVAAWARSGQVAMVTLAPERVGASDVIRTLYKAGIVISLGHSAASYEQAVEAFESGVSSATHVFNAMAPTTAREPGASFAALQDARVTVGLILDGHHVHPSLVRAAWTLAADRIALVTDSTAAAGQPSGEHKLGDVRVVLRDGVVRNQDGGLAGSALTLDQAVRNLKKITECSLAAAIRSVTTVPAALLGLPAPTVTVGAVADLVLLDESLNVTATWVGGRRATVSFGEEE